MYFNGKSAVLKSIQIISASLCIINFKNNKKKDEIFKKSIYIYPVFYNYGAVLCREM